MNAQQLKELRNDCSRMFGMMAGSTNARSGRMVMAEAEMLRLLNFVQQVPVLIDQLESAERERNELRDKLKVAEDRLLARQAVKEIWQDRAWSAEEEIERRDAAAGEPLAFTHESEISNMRATGLYLRGFPTDRRLNAEEGYTVALYTAAPPAVFPAATDASQGWTVDPEYLQSIANCSCDADGVNPSLETVESVILALGAQQQKVVELPDPADESLLSTWQFNDAVINALDAANVKYEVKK